MPYLDTVGKLTWGVGRNLTDVPLSPDELAMVAAVIDRMLENDIKKAEGAAMAYSWYPGLSPVRKRVVLDMIFNLGPEGFSKFKATQAAIASGDYAKAAEQMLASRWASQVKGRAVRLTEMMKTGTDAQEG